MSVGFAQPSTSPFPYGEGIGAASAGLGRPSRGAPPYGARKPSTTSETEAFVGVTCSKERAPPGITCRNKRRADARAGLPAGRLYDTLAVALTPLSPAAMLR